MNIRYLPVSCSFMDYIEDFATRKVRGRILYLSMGKEEEIFDTVKTWVLEDEQEFLITTTYKEKIRLDRIIRLFDVPGPAHAGYSSSCF